MAGSAPGTFDSGGRRGCDSRRVRQWYEGEQQCGRGERIGLSYPRGRRRYSRPGVCAAAWGIQRWHDWRTWSGDPKLDPNRAYLEHHRSPADLIAWSCYRGPCHRIT